MICEIKEFVDDKGRRVTAIIPTGEGIEEAVFKGVVGLMTNMGPMKQDFDFPEGYTLEQCFNEFETIAKQEIDKLVEEVQDKNRIMTPQQAQKDGIIVP